MGHQFLWEIGDSISLVLPVQKEAERYKLQFENEFAFVPDQLSAVVHQLLREKGISQRYIVEVESCDSAIIVHSFEAHRLKDKNAIACKGRALPESCYNFYFTVLPTEESPLKTKKEEEAKVSYLFFILPLVLLISLLIYYLRQRNKLSENAINIGQFEFDQKRLLLKLKTQSIELSAKEADLLMLLHQHESQTLERAFILNQIWGDEGDYVGRTLDVFISKLRKKMAADPKLKIINIRGVGYRFVVA